LKTASTTIWLLFLALLGACRGGGEKMPDGVLPPDRMARVTADMLVAKEAYAQKKKIFDSEDINPERSVLHTYGIDSVTYYRSLDYYSAHLDLFAEVYKQVDTLLHRRSDSLLRQSKPVKDAGKQKKKSPPPSSSDIWRPSGP